MKYFVAVKMDRLASVCAFIGNAFKEGVIDEQTLEALTDLVTRDRGKLIDIEERIVEHDPAGWPMLEEWLCRRRSA